MQLVDYRSVTPSILSGCRERVAEDRGVLQVVADNGSVRAEGLESEHSPQ